MNPEVKNRWLQALRSGTYPPNPTGYLAIQLHPEAPVQYSAFGVLCELAAEAGLHLAKATVRLETLDSYLGFAFNSQRIARPHHAFTYDQETIWLPQPVADWAHLPARLWLKRHRVSAVDTIAYISAQHQDGTFEEVAELIQDQL